jgi:hypothetical protein
MKKIWAFIKIYWRLWLFALIATIIGIVVFNIMWGDPALSTAIVALGTLLLALATVLTIEDSRQREKHRREEEHRIRTEEKKYEFKRRCIDDIYDWARGGIAVLAEFPPSVDTNRQRDIFIHIAPLRSINNWMMNASRQLDEIKLVRSVDEAAEKLKQYEKKLENRAIGTDQEHEECRASLNKVLECIADLKVKLRL